MNDLPNKLKTTNSIHFADDTTIIRSGKFPAFQDEISTELQVFDDWSLSNELRFNPKKFRVLTFGKNVHVVLSV